MTVRKRIARGLRRVAGKIDKRPDFEFPRPDPVAEAIRKQTEALGRIEKALDRKDSLSDGIRGVCVQILGPPIVRAVEEARADGVVDSEILSALTERLADGWF